MTRTTTVSLVALAMLGAGLASAWGCSSSSAAHGAADAAVGPAVDGGCNPPDDAACLIDPQCGCLEGQKCDFAGDAGTATCVHAGAGVSGALCTTETDCAVGLTCVSGVCHPFCPQSDVLNTCPAATSGPTLGLCNQVNVNAAAVAQDSYCFFACTPSPNDCPAGQGCVIDTVEGTNYSDCQVAGPVAVGGACTTDANCAAGAICYTADAAANVCMELCLAAKDCASFGTGLQCDTTIGLALDGVLYGLCD